LLGPGSALLVGNVTVADERYLPNSIVSSVAPRIVRL